MAPSKPWFRIHNTIVDNPKIQRLPDALVRPWLNLVAIANGNGGVLPSMEDVAFRMRSTVAKCETLLETFRQRRLFDLTENGWEPHDWNDWQYKSDVSTERVKAFRERSLKQPRNVSGNVSETPNETDQRQSRDRAEDTEANASDTRKPKRATALPADWTPNERNLSDAKSRGYDQPRVVELAEQFRDYHHAKGSTSKDWDASWRTWLANDKRFSAGRSGSGKPGPNRPGAGSVVDVVARLKARADLGGQGQRGGVGRGGDGVSPAEDDRGGYGPSDCAGGEIIDADDAERMHRPPGRTQAARTPGEHDGADDGSAALAVFAQALGVPGGRGAQGADDTAEHEPVLAVVVGTEGEVGHLHSAAPEAAGRPEITDDMPDLPDFLRRT